jgi:MFS family permease
MRRLTEAARRLTRADPVLRAVVVEGFFTRLGFGIVTLYLPLYALELGMSLTEVGLLAGAKALIAPAVKPVMGIVVDRFGARRGYLVAVWLRFAGAALLLLATTPLLLFAVRFLQGAASAARDPASVTVLAKQARTRLGRTFSTAIGAKDLGNVSAGLVGGALLAISGGSFPVLWVLVAVLALVPVAAVWRWVPVDLDAGDGSRQPADEAGRAASRAGAAPEQAPAPASGPDARILRHPRLRRIAALGLLSGLTAHMLHGLFQVYAAEVAGLSAGTIGAVYSASIATLLVVGPLAGWVADRVGTGPLAGVRGVANAVSSVVYLAFPVLGGVIAGRLVDDTGKAAFRPAWGALVAGETQRAGARGGRVAAGLDTALSIGEALGPLLAGLVWDLAGVGWFFALRAVLGIATEVVLGRRLRATDEDPPAEEPDAATARPPVLDAAALAPGGTVGARLRAQAPAAEIEALARAWTAAGLRERAGELTTWLDARVADLGAEQRLRLAVAAAVVADAPEVRVDADGLPPHAVAVLASALRHYPGTVLAVPDAPAPERPVTPRPAPAAPPALAGR